MTMRWEDNVDVDDGSIGDGSTTLPEAKDGDDDDEEEC
jgi:hypothetical protein